MGRRLRAEKVNNAALGSKLDRIVEPLAEASKRLRDKAGRPKLGRPPRYKVTALSPDDPIGKMLVDDLPSVPVKNTRRAATPSRSTPATASNAEPETHGPRLLSVKDAAKYLGVSVWTIRDWTKHGVLSRVHVPSNDGRGVSRSVLYERRALDRLVQEGG